MIPSSALTEAPSPARALCQRHCKFVIQQLIHALEAERLRTGARHQAHVRARGESKNPAMVRSTYREEAESDGITKGRTSPV